MIYLDPHTTQDAIDFEQEDPSTAFETYTAPSYGHTPLDGIDPSMALCFYFKTKADFDKFCECVSNYDADRIPFSIQETEIDDEDNEIISFSDEDINLYL